MQALQNTPSHSPLCSPSISCISSKAQVESSFRLNKTLTQIWTQLATPPTCFDPLTKSFDLCDQIWEKTVHHWSDKRLTPDSIRNFLQPSQGRFHKYAYWLKIFLVLEPNYLTFCKKREKFNVTWKQLANAWQYLSRHGVWYGKSPIISHFARNVIWKVIRYGVWWKNIPK